MTYTRGTGWVEVDAKLPRKKMILYGSSGCRRS